LRVHKLICLCCVLAMVLPLDTFVLIGQHFAIDRTLLHFGTSCRYAHQVVTELADQFITSFYEGVHAQILHARPSWIRLLFSLKPKILVKADYNHWPNLTRPLPFVLDSRGPFFVEFAIIISKSLKGKVMIGLVDAGVSLGAMHTGDWPLDLSLSQAQQPKDKRRFAISFSPGSAITKATLVEGNSQELLGGEITRRAKEHCSYIACLNWMTLGNEKRGWNFPIQAGFFLENGCLSLWRKEGKDWHSSGVICQALPPKVLPCVFLASFKGYACVHFSGLRHEPPECCPHFDASHHGTADGWMSWKALQRWELNPCPFHD